MWLINFYVTVIIIDYLELGEWLVVVVDIDINANPNN